MRRILLAGVMLVGVLSGAVEGGTVAYFTSSAGSTGNQFTAGTLTLSTSPASALLTFSSMVPGDKVTAPLTVSNPGGLDFVYAVASAVTNADGKGLGAQVTLTVKRSVTACTNAGFDTDGTVLYGPALPLGSLAGSLNLIGDVSAYPNGGRTLASSGSEVLCFQAQLPATTAASYAGATTTATFTFAAQQQ